MKHCGFLFLLHVLVSPMRHTFHSNRIIFKDHDDSANVVARQRVDIANLHFQVTLLISFLIDVNHVVRDPNCDVSFDSVEKVVACSCFHTVKLPQEVYLPEENDKRLQIRDGNCAEYEKKS